MSKMMDKWLQQTKPGDKGLTRPPVSARVSAHKNEVRSIVRGYFQNRFKVRAYKQVGRPTHDSQKREDTLERVTSTHYPTWVVRLCPWGVCTCSIKTFVT